MLLEKTCMDIVPRNNLNYTCSAEFYFRSICTYTCSEGYDVPTNTKRTNVCLASGKWNTEDPTCVGGYLTQLITSLDAYHYDFILPWKKNKHKSVSVRKHKQMSTNEKAIEFASLGQHLNGTRYLKIRTTFCVMQLIKKNISSYILSKVFKIL